ncbi:MAG: ABC transporter permease [Candidatus Aminicenantes bacterium]|nr:ABC transporter permease [Candidatus Aminicenantes bacterium]
MIRNYLKVAFRNIKRHKIYSFINIFGLSVGMACCILIFLYVQHENSYDNFHVNKDNIYRLAATLKLDIGDKDYAQIQSGFAPIFADEFPEIESFVRVKNRTKKVMFYKEKKIGGDVTIADSNFFNFFSFELIKGDPDTVLKDPSSIVLTESLSKKIFGDEEPIGKTLRYDDKSEGVVSGITKDVPENSHIQFDAVNSIENTLKEGRTLAATYLQLNEFINPMTLESKFTELEKARDWKMWSFFLQPLKSIYFSPGLVTENGKTGEKKNSYYLSILAILIMIVACINFMNLSTTRSLCRAKEVGVRKVIGANRPVIIKQFLFEAMFLASIALFFALQIAYILLPFFNALAGTNLTLDLVGNSGLYISLAGIVLISGLLTGSYPAVLLSSFQPVAIIRGKIRSASTSSRLRKVLVVAQFTISVIFIIGTLVLAGQMNYIKNKDLNFEKDNILFVSTYDFENQKNTFKNEILLNPNIINAALCTYRPSNELSWPRVVRPEGMPEEETINIPLVETGPDFFKTFKVEFADGRDFSRERTSDVGNAVIVNQTAVKVFGWENPVGKTIKINISEYYEDRLVTVVGVVKDFHFEPLRNQIGPYIFHLNPEECHSMAIKIRPENMQYAISSIQNTWLNFAPDKIFSYDFLDEMFGQAYQQESRTGKILGSASILAIIIASLGLFGLASFMAETRIKEIGIRKVFGASVSSIIMMMSKDFIKLVVVANGIALPVAYFFMNKWLENFAYHINIGILIPALAVILSLFVAVLTVSFQSIKAAVANPIESIKYE